MSVGATCTVCNHANATAINAALASGQMSQRRIADQFGLKHDAVRRHVINRHPGVIVASDTPALPPLEEGASPREKLERLIAQLEAQMTGGNARVDVSRELRLAYGDLEKMSGGASPIPTSYRDLEGWAEYEAAVFAALEPFPEAQAALAAALKALDPGEA